MATDNVEMNAVANSDVKTVNPEQNGNCCKNCTNAIVGALENGFAKLGGLIARNAVAVIIISLGICLLFLIGLMDKYEENRPERLWVSSSSESLDHRNWFSDNYPPEFRICQVIVESDNFLTPDGLRMLCNIDEGVKGISKNDSKTPNLNWGTKCLSPARNGICTPSTILQLWKNNCTYITSLNQAQIIAELSVFMRTPALMRQLQNLTLLLGDITYDSIDKTKVIKAKATKMTYLLKNEEEYIYEKGRRIDERGTAWEEAFVEFLKNKTTAGDAKLSYYTLTSRQSDSRTTIGGDLILLGIGYILIILYLAIMLGSFSRINHKVWLAVCGVVCIGLSFGVSYGLSSAFQLIISPVHNVLPFLLLGIGVDDIFVIIRTWQNLERSMDKDASIPDKVAHMMQHAGVSILVTSFTDVCAFLIGATTVLPALRSFCVFAGIGIIAVFILTCTFFVAWLTLDNRRQRSFRDACCCCIKIDSDKWSPMECSKVDYLQLFMQNVYTKVLLSMAGRIFVMLTFLVILAGGAYGLSQLKQDFDPDWFLPPDSMTIQFKTADEKYFPDGVKAAVYVGKINYFAEQNKISTLYDKINANNHVVDGSVVSWYKSYTTWLKAEKNLLQPRNETEFYKYLNEFLLSRGGAKFHSDVKIDNKTKKIKATRIKYSHIKLYGATQEIKAMDSIQDIAKSINFNDFQAFGYSRFYVGWETNKIISTELIRNLILAGVVVLVVTLVLLADIAVSIMVLLCMVMTLIDIAGYMHFWGVTVDTVTTILLVLAIGLSVDYSAHIAHAFMASREGNRVERARNALVTIGPAVFHGGFSTFLAFVCLAGSKSYVFSTFFKLFFLVVIFGLFHGLVFLPVLLSFIGSSPYAAVEISPQNEINTKEVNNTEPPTSPDNQAYDDD